MYTAVVITVNNAVYNQQQQNSGGALVSELLASSGYSVLETSVVPDNQQMIEQALCNACDVLNANLVITTGGTGFAKTDVTPEATRNVCDKMAGGIADAIRASSLAQNPKAIFSRAEAGIRNNSIIINLPTNLTAVWESLQSIIPVLPYGIDSLLGNPTEE